MGNINNGISKTINKWGDSMVQGAGGDGMNVTVHLLGFLPTERVINQYGIGGQTSTQIATRFGAIPCYVTATGGAFSTVGVPVTLSNMSSYFLRTAADNTSRYASGTLLTTQGNVAVKQRCIIFRSATGTAPSQVEVDTIALAANYFGANATIAPDSIFIPDAGLNAVDDINTFWMGRNDPDKTKILASIVACVNYLANPKRFLVFGVLPNNLETTGTPARAEVDAHNTSLKNLYPDNYIQMTPPTTEEMAFIKYTPTSDDLTDIANGIFPRGMKPTGDITHLNGIGYKIIALREYRKFVQFGWDR